jgi:HK97 family phage portal protein
MAGLLSRMASRLYERQFPSRVSIPDGNALDSYVMRQIANIALYPDYSSDTYLGAYTGNGDVFTIINKITEPASNVPVFQYDKNGEINENGKMIQLLNKPNPFMSRAELIEASLTFFLIFGDSYTASQSVPNGLNAGLPIRLDVLPPQWVEFVLGTYLNPVRGYKFLMSGNQIDYEYEQIVHWKEFNPDYDNQGTGHLKGMSRLKPLLKSVTGSGSAYDALVASFQHHGAMGILTILGEDGKAIGIGKPLMSQIKQQIREEYMGTDKNGSVVITNKDHKWTNFGLTIVEMAVLDALGAFGGRICDAYNVPSMLLAGSKDRTYMNYKEAKKALYQDAIMPNLDAYLNKLTRWLAPIFKEDDQVLKADYSGIDVLQDDKAALVAWMILSKSFTKNEIRKAVGAEELPDPAMDKVYESAGLMPLDELGLMPNMPLTESVMKALKIKDYRNAAPN